MIGPNWNVLFPARMAAVRWRSVRRAIRQHTVHIFQLIQITKHRGHGRSEHAGGKSFLSPAPTHQFTFFAAAIFTPKKSASRVQCALSPFIISIINRRARWVTREYIFRIFGCNFARFPCFKRNWHLNIYLLLYSYIVYYWNKSKKNINPMDSTQLSLLIFDYTCARRCSSSPLPRDLLTFRRSCRAS